MFIQKSRFIKYKLTSENASNIWQLIQSYAFSQVNNLKKYVK
jgi:hypothetical protein